MKNRFSTVIIMALNTALTVIGLFMFGPLQVFIPGGGFLLWLWVWRTEVRADQESQEIEATMPQEVCDEA